MNKLYNIIYGLGIQNYFLCHNFCSGRDFFYSKKQMDEEVGILKIIEWDYKACQVWILDYPYKGSVQIVPAKSNPLYCML